MKSGSRRIGWRSGAGLVSVTALSLVLAACGGGAASDASSAASSAAETPEAAASSAAPTAEETAAAESLRVGVIYLDSNSGFYAGVKKGVDALAAESGVAVEITEANSLQDPSKEASFVQGMIADQVDAILISATSADASIPAIKAAHDAGIPVICYNTCIQEPELSQYVAAYAVGDQVEFGYKAGLALADALIAGGITEPKIGVVNCEFVEVCKERAKGFSQALSEKVPGFEIVDSQRGGDASASLTAAQNILTAHPDINAFFGQYGDATVGAVRAVQAADMTGKIIVVGGDMSTPLAENMVDGSVAAMVDISGIQSGRTALQTTLDIIAGNAPAETKVNVPVDLFSTPEQAQTWIDEHPDGIS